MTKQLSKNDVVQLLDINNFMYARTAPVNPVQERTMKKSFAEGGGSSKYNPSDHIIINLQSGTDFISTQNSFLVFDVKVERKDAVVPTTNLTPSVIGSAINLFSSSTTTTRSGKEMDRVENLNLLQYHLLRNNTDDFIEKNAQSLFKANYVNPAPARAQIGVTDTRVMIPLKYISPIFDSMKLMPPHLSRGLRVELTCEDFARALTLTDTLVPTTDPDAYSISKVHILTDNLRLDDSILEYLNAEFASQAHGLVYEYKSWHTTKSTVSTADLNIEVRRSVSMALDTFCATSPSVTKQLASADSFASVAMADDDVSQWRIGSHYMPNSTVNGRIEHYAQMLYWNDNLMDDRPHGVDYDSFVSGGQGKFAQTLQRSNILDISGIAISNSNTLAVNATLGVAVARDVYVYLRHLRRAVLFLENVVLET